MKMDYFISILKFISDSLCTSSYFLFVLESCDSTVEHQCIFYKRTCGEFHHSTGELLKSHPTLRWREGFREREERGGGALYIFKSHFEGPPLLSQTMMVIHSTLRNRGNECT